MSERQTVQSALLGAQYMTLPQYDEELGTWGYYTKSAFRKFLEEIQITDVLREHLNSSVFNHVDELPTEVADALLAKGNYEVTDDEVQQEPEKDPEQNSEQESENENDENDEETDDTVEDHPEEETSEETEDAEDAEETSEEKPKARRSRRS